MSFQASLRRPHTATVIVQFTQLADTDGSSLQGVHAPLLPYYKDIVTYQRAASVFALTGV